MQPGEIHTLDELTRALDVVRRRAARGSGRGRVSLADLAQRTGIPRSTVHVYLSGRTLPPPDALDAVLQALDVPAAELRAWADALERVATPAADPAPDPEPARDTTPVPHQLPPARRGFVGRSAELTRLDDLLAAAADDPAPLVVALSGFGGVGKTTLASTWASRHVDDFPDGQLWIDLHGYGLQDPVTASAALGRLLRACGVDTAQLPGDTESRAELFRSTVAGRRLLLVLDNAVDSAHVRPLLAGAPGCVVVVTSRSELRSLVAETGAARLRLTPLDAEAGRVLLLAGGGDLPASLTDRLVQHCAGLPLALRILSERIAGRTVEDVDAFAADLDDRQARLEALETTDGRDEYGMRTVLQASYAALTDDAAATFRVLPLCLGRAVDVADVAACIDQPVALAGRRLDALAAANLIRVVGRDLYAVDDLVATFAEEVRLESGAADDVDADRRVLTRLTDVAVAVNVALSPGWDTRRPLVHVDPERVVPELSERDAVEWLREHLDQVGTVVVRALARGDLTEGWYLLAASFRAALGRCDLSPLLPALHAAVDAAGAREADDDLAVLTLHSCSIAEGSLARFGAARVLLERLAVLARARGDDGFVDIATSNLANVELRSGWPHRALALTASLLPDIGDWTRQDLNNVAVRTGALLAAGDDAGALATAEQAVLVAERTHEATPDIHFANALGNLAWVLSKQGGPAAEITALLHRCRAAVAPIAELELEMFVARLLATVSLEAGDVAGAARILDPVLASARTVPAPEAVDALVVHARVLRAQGRLSDAELTLVHTIDRAVRLDLVLEATHAASELVGVLAAGGQPARVRRLAEHWSAVVRERGIGVFAAAFDTVGPDTDPADVAVPAVS